MIQSHILFLFFLFVMSFSVSTEPELVSLQPYDCIECHGDLKEHQVMHYPAEDACDNCHEPTGASHPSVDSMGFRLMDKVPALCYYCHEEGSEMAHPHQAVAGGNCLACHDAHGSSETSLMHQADPDLCLSCHRKQVRGDMRLHSAIPGGGCMSCHQAHGSDFRALLEEYFPEEDYVPASTENFELCFLCHDTDLMEAEETEWGTGFRNGKRNLHYVHINGNKGRNCRMCHNIHGSRQAFLIEENVGFGSWEMQMNFIPDEQGGSCLPGCHGKLSYQR